MFLQWQGRLYADLVATVHFIDTGLTDDWLRGSSIGSTEDLGLNRYLVEMPMLLSWDLHHLAQHSSKPRDFKPWSDQSLRK